MGFVGRPKRSGPRESSGRAQRQSKGRGLLVQCMREKAEEVSILSADEYPAIYVITGDQSNSCKIGISKEPGKRCADMQVGSRDVLRVFWACRLQRDHAIALEKAIHEELALSLNHARGEWYFMSGDTAVSTIRKIAHLRGFELLVDLRFGVGRERLSVKDLKRTNRNGQAGGLWWV